MARLPSDRRTWQPFIWDDARAPPRATHPDDWPGNGLAGLSTVRVIPIRSCSRWGLPCRRALPPARWALTPPFHPYPHAPRRAGRFVSVALSLGSPPPDVIRHRVSVEPGLSSPRGLSAPAKRGCPANWWLQIQIHAARVKRIEGFGGHGKKMGEPKNAKPDLPCGRPGPVAPDTRSWLAGSGSREIRGVADQFMIEATFWQ